MARVIEEVAVKIGADTRGLDKGMQKAEEQVKGLTTGFTKASIAITAIAAATGFAVRGLLKMGSEANEMVKTARLAGLAANEYQRLAFTFKEVGLGASSASGAVNNLQDRLADPKFTKFFRRAGLDRGGLRALSPAVALEQTLTRLAQQGGDPRLAELTSGVFSGRHSREMLTVVRRWKELTETRKDYDRLVGKGLSKEDARRIEKQATQVSLLSSQWTNLKQTIVSEFAPAVTAALKAINESGFFEDMGSKLRTFVALFNDLGDAIKLVSRDIGNALPTPALKAGGGLPLKGVNTKTGRQISNDVVGLSPLGLLSKTISGDAIHLGRQSYRQRDSTSILNTNNHYKIDVRGFADGTGAGKAVRKELDREKR